MAESTKEYKIKRREAEQIAKCSHGWQLSGSPNKEDVNSSPLTNHSIYYDIQPFCKYEEDEFYHYESFSFDPKTNRLYISEEAGDISRGEYKIKLVKRIKYKKKWLRKFLKCQGKN